MNYSFADERRAAPTWLAHQLFELAAALRERALWLALAVALCAWALAYQASSAFFVPIGGDVATRLRHYDEPFLNGFNAPEPDVEGGPEWYEAGQPPYRWSTDHAMLTLPGVGEGAWRVRLLMRSGRPDNSSARARLHIGSGAPLELDVGPRTRWYEVRGRAEGGTLTLTLESERLNAPGDRRNLGVVVYALAATPLGSAPLIPAGSQVLLQSIVLLAVYVVARYLGAPPRLAAAMALALAALAAWLLATDRLGLAVVTPRIAILAGVGVVLAPALSALVGRGAAALGIRAAGAAPGAAAGLVLAGFWVRMVGVVHPYTRFSDLGFHIHNLQRVAAGQVFLLAGLPCEAGAGQAPYPPAMSLILAPGILAGGASDDAVRWLLLGGTALLEAGAAAWIWLLLRAAGFGQRAALAGAALYVAALPMLESYTVGELANIFGQIWLAPLLLALVVWRRSAGRPALLAGFLAAALFLSHTGVTLSTLALLAAWMLLVYLGGPRSGRERWRTPAMAALAFGSAGILALGVFYSAYAYLPAANQANALELAARTPPLICPPHYPLASKLANTIGLGIGPEGSLAFALVIAAAAGLLLAWRTPLGLLTGAALLGAALSFATLLTSDQPVRWAQFVYPIACAAGALAIERWSWRGRAGRVLAGAVVLWVVWFGLFEWIAQLDRYH